MFYKGTYSEVRRVEGEIPENGDEPAMIEKVIETPCLYIGTVYNNERLFAHIVDTENGKMKLCPIEAISLTLDTLGLPVPIDGNK